MLRLTTTYNWSKCLTLELRLRRVCASELPLNCVSVCECEGACVCVCACVQWRYRYALLLIVDLCSNKIKWIMHVKLLRRGICEANGKAFVLAPSVGLRLQLDWKKRQTEKRKFRQAPRKVFVGNVLVAQPRRASRCPVNRSRPWVQGGECLS